MSVDVVCVEQRISIGGKFDGTLPTTSPVDTGEIGVRYYPPDASGGLFKFFPDLPAMPEKRNRWLHVRRVLLDMNGLDIGDVWTLRIVSTNGDAIWMSDGVGNYAWESEGSPGLIIAPDEELKLFNTLACTAELFARMWATPFQV